MRTLPLIVLLLLCAGCVERRLYIRSEPAGAEVYIDGERVGVTRPEKDPAGPLYVNFAYYGAREYTLRKPGFKTVTGVKQLVTPWYEYPPMDFFSEVMAPWLIVDEHEVDVKLEPVAPADVEQLYRDARAYREDAQPQSRFEYAAAWGKR
ncbi:MAG: PEGA domain-containing protein [Planctomycetes bacterium]|nr:PEGA domain-containing protein [Planctomycetota bacterium]